MSCEPRVIQFSLLRRSNKWTQLFKGKDWKYNKTMIEIRLSSNIKQSLHKFTYFAYHYLKKYPTFQFTTGLFWQTDISLRFRFFIGLWQIQLTICKTLWTLTFCKNHGPDLDILTTTWSALGMDKEDGTHFNQSQYLHPVGSFSFEGQLRSHTARKISN